MGDHIAIFASGEFPSAVRPVNADVKGQAFILMVSRYVDGKSLPESYHTAYKLAEQTPCTVKAYTTKNSSCSKSLIVSHGLKVVTSI